MVRRQSQDREETTLDARRRGHLIADVHLGHRTMDGERVAGLQFRPARRRAGAGCRYPRDRADRLRPQGTAVRRILQGENGAVAALPIHRDDVSVPGQQTEAYAGRYPPRTCRRRRSRHPQRDLKTIATGVGTPSRCENTLVARVPRSPSWPDCHKAEMAGVSLLHLVALSKDRSEEHTSELQSHSDLV